MDVVEDVDAKRIIYLPGMSHIDVAKKIPDFGDLVKCKADVVADVKGRFKAADVT